MKKLIKDRHEKHNSKSPGAIAPLFLTALLLATTAFMAAVPSAGAIPVEDAILHCPKPGKAGLFPYRVLDVYGSLHQQYWVLEEQASVASLLSPTSWTYHARVGWMHDDSVDWKGDHARLWSDFSGNPNGGLTSYDSDLVRKMSHKTGNGSPACGELVVNTGLKLRETGNVFVDIAYSGVDFWVQNGYITTKSYSYATTDGESSTISGEIGASSNSGATAKIGGSNTWSESTTEEWGRSDSTSIVINMNLYHNRVGGYHYVRGGGDLV